MILTTTADPFTQLQYFIRNLVVAHHVSKHPASPAFTIINDATSYLRGLSIPIRSARTIKAATTQVYHILGR